MPSDVSESMAGCITIVRMDAAGADPRTLQDLIARTAPAYQSVEGLLRKYFVLGTMQGGGVYEWRNEADARQWFNETWAEQMRNRYGTVPTVEYFAVLASVDNIDGQIHQST